KEGALKRMIQRLPERFEAVERGATLFATLLNIDVKSGKTRSIERIKILPD
ncbi:MAG: metallophosphoesterase, partial [Zetaproteobacteria bacterium CG02_land_8_20_14_3_00_50_9]